WPLPVAETLAAYEASRNPHQARDRMWDLVAVITRFLAVLAVASRSRIGQVAPEPARVTDAIRSLFRTGLGERGWLDLAVELCRPWASRAQAHPLPELVALLCDDDGGGRAALESLIGRREEEAHGGQDEGALRRMLEACVADLGRFISAAGFLADYPLVVGRDDGAEMWAGALRRHRIEVAVRGRQLDD